LGVTPEIFIRRERNIVEADVEKNESHFMPNRHFNSDGL
jgi:hypothetical protein